MTTSVSSLDASRELGHEIGSKSEVNQYLMVRKRNMADFQFTQGDTVQVTQEKQIQIRADADLEIVLFDVPLNE
jgi:hypothetical protein